MKYIYEKKASLSHLKLKDLHEFLVDALFWTTDMIFASIPDSLSTGDTFIRSSKQPNFEVSGWSMIHL